MNVQTHYSGQFKTIYNGTPWYGKSICRILAPIDAETAFKRLPAGEAHTIAELLAHMISWKQTLVDRLKRDDKPKPRQKDTFLTLAYGVNPETAWPRLKQAFENQHLELLGLLQPAAGAKPGKQERLPHRMIRGVMQHDLYHLGQIALLKKALKKL